MFNDLKRACKGDVYKSRALMAVSVLVAVIGVALLMVLTGGTAGFAALPLAAKMGATGGLAALVGLFGYGAYGSRSANKKCNLLQESTYGVGPGDSALQSIIKGR